MRPLLLVLIALFSLQVSAQSEAQNEILLYGNKKIRLGDGTFTKSREGGPFNTLYKVYEINSDSSGYSSLFSDSTLTTCYVVISSLNTPPVSPTSGNTYLVGNAPTGAWATHAKDIAAWNGSAWTYTDAVQGNYLYNAANSTTYQFRSGSWVQTGGIPALNGGNNISSGFTLGTNNAMSLNFETNNTRAGRIDSVQRFHIYNLPNSSTADTFILKTDVNGKLSKENSNSFINGIKSAFFKNGVKIIEDTSYTLSSADAGYDLIAINANTHFIMPDTCPFSVGDVIGLSGDLDTTTFDLSSSVTDIELFTGQSSETGEIFIMQCVDVGSGEEMLPLTAIKNDNGVLKTLNKYFFDKLSYIPEYANDAAADADANLVSGRFYKLTGNRTLFTKP